MNWLGGKVGVLLARYLEQPSKKYETFAAMSSWWKGT
jgi:hypothetical protein